MHRQVLAPESCNQESAVLLVWVPKMAIRELTHLKSKAKWKAYSKMPW